MCFIVLLFFTKNEFLNLYQPTGWKT